MGPNERIFKKEYAQELFRIAENDLLTSRSLKENPEVRKETVLFHVEQAVEKALKAVLCHRGLPLPMSHDLFAVVQRFPAADAPPNANSLYDLTPFASIRRYEEGKAILTEEDVAAAIQSATECLQWAKARLIK